MKPVRRSHRKRCNRHPDTEEDAHDTRADACDQEDAADDLERHDDVAHVEAEPEVSHHRAGLRLGCRTSPIHGRGR